MLPQDSTAVKLAAAKENAAAQKQVAVPSYDVKELRAKIERGNAVEAMTKSPGFGALNLWVTDKWSFKMLMASFKDDKADMERKMMQREGIQLMFDWIKMTAASRDTALNQINEMEENKNP